MNFLLFVKSIIIILDSFEIDEGQNIKQIKNITKIIKEIKSITPNKNEIDEEIINDINTIIQSFEKDLFVDFVHPVNQNIKEGLERINLNYLLKMFNEKRIDDYIKDLYSYDPLATELNSATERGFHLIIDYLLSHKALLGTNLATSEIELYTWEQTRKNSEGIELLISQNDKKMDIIEEFTSLLRKLKKENISNDNTKQLIDYSETTKTNHFNVLSTRIKVDDIFTLGNYKIIEMEENDVYLSSTKIKSIDEVLDIINEQRLFLIEGDYGTGKTILSLKLELELVNRGAVTYFCDATKLMEIRSAYKDIKTYFSEYMSENNIEELYLFIDSLDILGFYDNYSNPRIIENLLETFYDLINDNNIIIVANSRGLLYDGARIQESFACEYNTEKGPVFKYINSSKFNSTQVDLFFESLEYDYIKGKNVEPIPLSMNYLETWNKRVSESCFNPLFAFVLGHYYYKNKRELPNAPLDIYNDFIEKTIEGKYQSEKQKYPFIPSSFKNKYRNFLANLARELILERNNIIYYEDDYKDLNEWIVQCEQKKAFSYPYKHFSSEVNSHFKSDSDVYEASKESQIIGNILNCFFFRIYETGKNNKWICFSDDNFLCCLAVERICELINDMVNNSGDIEELKEELFVELGKISLRPMILDFIITSIMQYSEADQKKLLFILSSIMEKYEKESIYSSNGIQAQIILHIIFLKFYKLGYDPDHKHFFKRFKLMCKIAKAMELTEPHSEEPNHHRYLEERYFTNCRLIKYTFKRINLKYYNFNKSYIKDVNFEQCRFNYNDECKCELNNVKFNLCSISFKKLELELIGNIEFNNCSINTFYLSSINILSEIKEPIVLSFSNCTITQMRIMKCSSRRIVFNFNNCILQQIDFQNSNCKLIIKNCVINSPIKLIDFSDIRFIENNNLKNSNNQCFQIDDNSICSILPNE